MREETPKFGIPSKVGVVGGVVGVGVGVGVFSPFFGEGTEEGW